VHEGLVTTNIANIAANVDRLDVHEGLVMQNIADISSNSAAIAGNSAGIASNAAQIGLNSAEIASLGQDVYSLRSGIAATLATAGMPMAPGKGWGISVGVGSYDSEGAIAGGLTYAGDRVNFKFAVGDADGETTVSAGVAWNL